MPEKRFLPILKVNSADIKSRVLTCGDPVRAAMIAGELDRAEEIAYNREYRLFNGEKDGVELTVVSHGVGAAGAAVCFEELIQGGARMIIRIGTAGSLNHEIRDGDIIVASAAVREDGLTDKLIALSYPAVASYQLVNKLEEAGKELGIKSSTGIVLTTAAFYPELEGVPNKYFSQAGVIAVEMEASALFVIAALHGVAAGAVLAIDGMAINFDGSNYNPHRVEVDQAIQDEIKLAIKAIVS